MRYSVFVYGSLLSPESLLSTLPEADLAEVRPSRLRGYQRVFDVAFPNDGSQSDKSYFDDNDGRPPFVLFANLAVRPSAVVNGVVVPVSESQLQRLCDRERRYQLTECSDLVDNSSRSEASRVVTFVGAPEFTAPERVDAGVAAKNYVDLMHAGARFWDERHPGFLNDFHMSTRMPSAAPIVPLRRVDHT